MQKILIEKQETNNKQKFIAMKIYFLQTIIHSFAFYHNFKG